LRIGLNLGDVIVQEDGDVYGKSINMAARLEGIADPGGILISSKVHMQAYVARESGIGAARAQRLPAYARGWPAP